MHDIKAIRDNPQAYDRGWALRGLEPQTPALLALDTKLRAAQTAVQEAASRRNEASKLIGMAKAKKDEERAQALMAEVEQLKRHMSDEMEVEAGLGTELRELLASLPNIPADDVPPGEDETQNVQQRGVGEPKRPNNPRDHVDLGAPLGMDFEAAARMSGARFVLLKGQVARLERALGQFMLDLQTGENGYTEVNPPLIVRGEAMYGTGQLPKFEHDLFKLVTSAPLVGGGYRHMLPEPSIAQYLIPTAEVSLTNIVREQILSEEELPLRLTALTPCFRSEAGASGRDTRGMIRQHQFVKCELVSITTPEASVAEHERMTNCAEQVLRKLGLAYRTMLLCAGDMGFTARKTYDLEVWLPSQKTYREISSCSNCGDFQARRMDARYRPAGEKGTRFVHTLNGSGLAVGRTLVAVLENYQDEGGRIAIPDALKPYMGGVTHLEPSS